MTALPALVWARNEVTPWLVLLMVALPAVAVSVPPALPNIVRPPKKPELLLTIVARPALLLSRKSVSPPSVLLIAIDAADVALWKIVFAVAKEPSFVIDVIPLVSALTMSN